MLTAQGIRQFTSIQLQYPRPANHVNIHIHGACARRRTNCNTLLSFRKYYEQGTAMVKSETRGFFSFTDDEVELFLTVSVSDVLCSLLEVQS